ncbi:capsular polysaccharide biosynthesis protein [Thalassobium sp. R2A62]|uniref:capsular polysaccharide biosynthesis protein n=1 Tax=Thalassobium sp. R2A62 TaxID=633131 RepID=UPI0001B1D1DF|nr:capsular polysaccharide biosynthesis protein [Thalassobium sp. R2A62]EET47233.1 capsular polysaccharide export protein KpsC [Thalassobium sp. R2A62]
MTSHEQQAAAGANRQRLFVYNGGFLTQKRIRRILDLSGYDIKLGKPSDGDLVGVWGQSPTSPRGEAVAAKTETPILRVEDAFLRSVLPGRDGQPPLGLFLDKRGVHFDPATISDLEQLLTHDPLDDTALLNRARAAIDRVRAAHLSKYNTYDLDAPTPKPGYVLVIDQTRGDASVKASRADKNTFLEMLYYAQEENPGARIIVKTHPETAGGHRDGYFDKSIENGQVTLFGAAVSPWALFDGATSVYTVSSQMGFEAIFAGHRPHVFGQPCYAGWGLTEDRNPVQRRQRKLTRAQLFAGVMMRYATWYDPYRDRLCEFEDALATLEAQVREWREDHCGWTGAEMRLWKRKPLQQVFGRYLKMRFGDAATDERRLMVWAGKATPEMGDVVRVEDGFLRSRGLGAELIPPLSLVTDTSGIYYDPTSPSDLEQLIADSPSLSNAARDRAKTVIRAVTASKLSKYNLQRDTPQLPDGHRILVPGQVEDDASIMLGTLDVTTNRDLLLAARDARPDAVILYKPHPDVEAGLRDGDVADATEIADMVVQNGDPIDLIDAVREVWTMTSLLGFEALLRGVPVTCLGQPFYSGWGLTTDRHPHPRRTARPDLTALAHAVLIDYPRYFDPKSGLACPVEVIIERLASGNLPSPGPFNRSVAKLQGVFASYAHLWR